MSLLVPGRWIILARCWPEMVSDKPLSQSQSGIGAAYTREIPRFCVGMAYFSGNDWGGPFAAEVVDAILAKKRSWNAVIYEDYQEGNCGTSMRASIPD